MTCDIFLRPCSNLTACRHQAVVQDRALTARQPSCQPGCQRVHTEVDRLAAQANVEFGVVMAEAASEVR
jgi:carbon monoxide dehydrogenase subunit G